MDFNKRIVMQVKKHLCYLVLFFVLYAIQTTPGLFSIGTVKPVWLVAFAVVLAIQEGEFIGALYGTLAGLMWELAAGRSMGAFSFFLLILCFCTAVAFMLYLRATTLNICLTVGIVMLCLCSIDFVFSYWLQGHDGIGRVFLYKVVPTALYTAAIAPVCRWLAQKIRQYFSDAE